MTDRPAATHRLETVALVIERIASFFLAAITILVFANALLRRAHLPIPDAFDMSRMLLMVAILWGLATVGYRDGHIKVDLLWMVLGRRGRRVLDVVSWLFLLAFTIALAWALYTKVGSVRASNERSFDLRLHLWPLYTLGWLGVCSSVVLVAVRFVLMLRGREPETRSLATGE